MRVSIPTITEVHYLNDKDKVYALGGRWNSTAFCYEFEQSDIEAYLLVETGQWKRED